MKKIRLLIDLDPMAVNQKSGVGFYTLGLLKELSKIGSENVQIIGHYFNFLGESRPEMPKLRNVTYKQTRLIPRKLVNLLRRIKLSPFYELLTKTRADFIIFPNFIGYPSIFKTPFAPVIHDLSYLDRPQDVTTKNRQDLAKLVPKFIRRAAFVIAASEATKGSLVSHYKIDESQIIVAPPPIPQNSSETAKIDMPEKYILFLSTLEPRKNFMALVKAYTESLSPELKKEYALVLAGGTGWHSEQQITEIKNLQDQGLNIITTGYVNDRQRAYLYKNASVFVLPSYYEGFGMPILEAMSHGVPSAVSDIPVFHEVADDAALFFDKDSPEDIAKTVEAVLTNKDLAEKLTKAGYENLKRFNWDKVAEDLYNRIKEVVENG